MTSNSTGNREVLVDTIIHERDGMRAELIEYQKAMHRAVFAFVAIGGVAASIYFGKVATPAASDSLTVLFLLSQAEFFLSLFGITLIAAQSVHAGYIAALEKRLNEIVGARASIWESEIVPRYMGHPRGSFFMASVCQILFLIGIFVAFVGAASTMIEKMIYGVLLTLEALAIVILFIWSQLDTKRVELFADTRFASSS